MELEPSYHIAKLISSEYRSKDERVSMIKLQGDDMGECRYDLRAAKTS